MSLALDHTDAAADLAKRLDRQLRQAAPQAILKVAIDHYGERLALVSSFGAESAVLLHMVAQLKPDIPILFLDTGMLFGQTLDYRKIMQAIAETQFTGYVAQEFVPAKSDALKSLAEAIAICDA